MNTCAQCGQPVADDDSFYKVPGEEIYLHNNNAAISCVTQYEQSPPEAQLEKVIH